MMYLSRRPPIGAFFVAAFMAAFSWVAQAVTVPITKDAVCITVGQVNARIPLANPGARLVAEIGGDGVAPFIARFNRIPPLTAFAADRVLVWSNPGKGLAIFLFGRGCLVTWARMGRAAFRQVFPDIALTPERRT